MPGADTNTIFNQAEWNNYVAEVMRNFNTLKASTEKLAINNPELLAALSELTSLFTNILQVSQEQQTGEISEDFAKDNEKQQQTTREKFNKKLNELTKKIDELQKSLSEKFESAAEKVKTAFNQLFAIIKNFVETVKVKIENSRIIKKAQGVIKGFQSITTKAASAISSIEISKGRDQLDKLTEKEKKNNNKKGKLEQIIEKGNRKLSETEAKLQKIQGLKEAQLAQLGERRKALSEDYQKALKSSEATEKDLSARQQQLAELRANINTLSTEMTNLSSELNEVLEQDRQNQKTIENTTREMEKIDNKLSPKSQGVEQGSQTEEKRPGFRKRLADNLRKLPLVGHLIPNPNDVQVRDVHSPQNQKEQQKG